ncbi:MAG: hypothetical protein ACLUIQ_11535 [Dialister invisus]
MVPRAGDVGDDKADLIALLHFEQAARTRWGGAYSTVASLMSQAAVGTLQYVGNMLFGEHDRLEPAAERKFVFF